MISKYNTGKHFEVTITDTSLAVARKQPQIAGEATLDGFYVLRTPVPESELPAPAVVAAYKSRQPAWPACAHAMQVHVPGTFDHGRGCRSS